MATSQDKSLPSQGDGSLRFEMPIYTKIGPAADMQWLFQERIPRRQVTLIEGGHGAGKSFVALDLAARFTRGLAWPAPWHEGSCSRGDSTQSEVGQAPFRGKVLLVTQQDDSGTVDRRLAGLGADTDQICRIETVETEERSHEYSAPEFSRRPLEFPRDMDVVREELASEDGDKAIGLVVIDPLSDFCDGPARVVQTLRELNKLAREMDVPIIVTLPANCRFDARGALRVTSRYKTEAARCVWCVVADRDNPARRLFVARRTNSCVEPPGLAFRLHDGHVVWNDKIPIDPLDPLGQESAIRDLLTSALVSGSLPAADVLRLGTLAGFAAAQLRVVAKLMGIEFRKLPGFGKEGGFEWVLPGEPCGVSPRVSGAARERGGEKAERRNDDASGGDGGAVEESKGSEGKREGTRIDNGSLGFTSQQPAGKPPEGGTRTFEVPVLISGTEIFAMVAAKEAETERADAAKKAAASRVLGETPLTVDVPAKERSVVEGAVADAKNPKSMENCGKNEHVSDGPLPRGKYARAQERKRREAQRRAGVVGSGRR